MKIIITGDFVINQPYLTSYISNEVKEVFNQSDFNIVNLEAPVTISQSKIIKTGPHLKADKVSTLSVLKALNIDLVTLANNHVLDYDQQGVFDTLAFCQENSIATVGAGKTTEEASKVFYLDTPEGKIALINIAENEWASATQTTAGANGMDLIDDVKQIQEAKSKSDFVFVIVHGGHEYYNLPSPRMQKQYRFYVDNGADLVIGHHTHCISGNEAYRGGSIYYSLGNFLFTKSNTSQDWYKGLILEINIQNKQLEIKHHFISQEKETFELSILKDKELEVFENRIIEYNKIITNSNLLDKYWKEYINERYDIYLNFWSPLSFVANRYIKAIFRKTRMQIINKLGLSYYLNLMRCEAHVDLSKGVISKYLNKK